MNTDNNFGYSSTMGPLLRAWVEKCLLNDLENYGINIPDPAFDWSFSCIEGRGNEYLDGYFENYSGIAILDKKGETIVEGWMDFAEDVHGHKFLFYWQFLDVFDGAAWISKKSSPGIPPHIWDCLSEQVRELRKHDKMKLRRP